MTPREARLSRADRRKQTEQRILTAARHLFAEVGYERATIRAVAARSEVDPALVMQYFGRKEDLFRQAIHGAADDLPPIRPERLTEVLLDVLTLKLSEPPANALALLRSMLTHPEATEQVRIATDRQLRHIAAAIPAEDAQLRAALLLATSLGVTVARYLLALDPLREATPDQIADLLRPQFQALTAP